MYVSLENDPLLFVQGPPVYRHIKKVSRWQEESTSIFPEPAVKEVETKPTDPVMWKRLRFLTTDFAKHVYKPLCFHLHDGEQVFGEVNELYPDSVQIKSPEDLVIALEINEIKEIWWKGKVLPTRF